MKVRECEALMHICGSPMCFSQTSVILHCRFQHIGPSAEEIWLQLTSFVKMSEDAILVSNAISEDLDSTWIRRCWLSCATGPGAYAHTSACGYPIGYCQAYQWLIDPSISFGEEVFCRCESQGALYRLVSGCVLHSSVLALCLPFSLSLDRK